MATDITEPTRELIVRSKQAQAAMGDKNPEPVKAMQAHVEYLKNASWAKSGDQPTPAGNTKKK